MKKRHFLKSGLVSLLVSMFIVSSAAGVFAADTEGTWVTKAPMPQTMGLFQTEEIDGKIYAMGGYQSGIAAYAISTVEEYDPTINEWIARASMSTARIYFQTEVVGGNIYAFGGRDINKNRLASVEEYFPDTNTWVTKSPMSTARSDFRTEIIDGKIFVIGGSDNNNSLSSVEEYDPATDKWTTKASMSTGRGNFQTEVINGKIYAMGGVGTIASSIEEYDPTANKWTTKASLPDSRTGFQTQVYNNKIYMFGGWDSNSDYVSSVYAYDPFSNQWISKASFPTPSWKFASTVINNKLYTFGGCVGGNPVFSTVEEYDFTTNKWTEKEALPVQTHSSRLEKINGNIYIIGGCDTNGVFNSVFEFILQPNPTLTVTASPDKLKVGERFSTDVAIHNVTNICAEDIKISYDTSLFKYEGAETQTGLKIYKEDTSAPGVVRFIVASQGKDNTATGDKGLIRLKFKAIGMGTGKVDITHGRIADNATLETDVAEENCGEDSITVDGYADVNKTGEFTLLDLGIDAYYDGMNAADTDQEKYNTDIVEDGIIDDNDLMAITQGILSNSNYGPNNS